MSMQAIVCDSSVIRGMSNVPRNICYHYRHHLTGKQVYHCEISYSEVVNGLIRDLQITIDEAEAFFANWKAEFTSISLSQTKQGERAGEEIQRRLSHLEGLVPEKTVKRSDRDCLIAGETITHGISELAAHDRDFLFIEVVCPEEISVVMLEMSPDGQPRPKRLTLPHRQRLEERLDMAGIGLNTSVVATD